MPPWEKYATPSTAAQPSDGPWTKFQPPKETKWRDPGMIVPVQFSEDGQARLAMPQIVTETLKAIQAPGKALQGGYGVEIDPATGRPTPITNEMIGDTMGTAGLGLTAFNPAAQAGAKFGANVIKPGAASALRKELQNAQIPLDQVGPRLSALGPDAMIADLSPGLRARAAAIATMPGNGAKTVVDALSARRANSNLRITSDVDQTLGPATVPSQMAAENTLSKEIVGPEYQTLFQNNAKAVDTSPIALDLDSMIVNMRGTAQKRAKEVRDMLNVSGSPEHLDPNPATLFETRNAIDGMLATENDPKAIGVLKNIRAQVDAMVAEAVPGLKEIDAKYAELARQGEAAKTGQQLLDSGRTAPRPSEVQDMMTNGALPQGLQVGPSAVPLRLRQGARAEIDRIIGTNVRDINAMKRIVAGEGNWNRDRLVSVFGEDKAARLLQILEREAAYNATEEMALTGSRTQVLKAAQEDIVGKGPQPNPIKSAANFQFGDAAASAADNALGWIFRARRGSTNASLANALTAGPQNLNMLSAISASGRPGPVVQQGGMNALRMLALQQ